MKRTPSRILNNFVAKYSREFNKSTVEVDKKREAKKNGFTKIKYKERYND